MGGQGSRPAHFVEVRLEPPLNLNPPNGLFFIARLHSAADGLAKYKIWGKPQPVGIWADDVITISIHAARTEAHFDRCKYEDIAELHLPWELICHGKPLGEEMVFDLAMTRGVPWLGPNALQGQYQEAFRRSVDTLVENPGCPWIRVGLREVPQFDAASLAPGRIGAFPFDSAAVAAGLEAQQLPPSPFSPIQPCAGGSVGASSPASVVNRGPGIPPSPASLPVHPSSPVAMSVVPGTPPPHPLSSVRQLEYSTPHARSQDQHQIFQLQARNRELREQCAALSQPSQPPLEPPDVYMQADERAHQLEMAASENNHLRAETRGIEQELADVCGQLATLGSSPNGLQDDEAAAQWEQHCSAIMSEIQAVIKENIELSSHCDEDIRALEEQISTAYWHQLPMEDSIPQDSAGSWQSPVGRLGFDEVEGELHELLAECGELESALQDSSAQARAIKAEAEAARYRLLQADNERCQQEIAEVRRHLKQVPTAVATEDLSIPGTAVLHAEVDHLQQKLADLQRWRAQEQVEFEERPHQLRSEMGELSQQLQDVAHLLAEVDNELQELQRAHEQDIQQFRHDAAARARSARQREEKELIRDALAKDAARSRRRIGVLDQKIEALQAEAHDLVERAGVARQSAPEGSWAQEIAQLEELMHKHEQSLLATRHQEEALMQEREEAQQQLDRAHLEARLAEHRVRLMRDAGVPLTSGHLS